MMPPMNRSPIALSRLILSTTVRATLAAMTALGLATPGPRPRFVYFGTYTGEKSRGIYVAPWDAATGKVGAVRLAAETENPSFLALHPSRPLLYAVNEVDHFGGEKAGAVSAFAIDPVSGDLRALGQVSSRGAGPCHLAVDATGRNVLV